MTEANKAPVKVYDDEKFGNDDKPTLDDESHRIVLAKEDGSLVEKAGRGAFKVDPDYRYKKNYGENATKEKLTDDTETLEDRLKAKSVFFENPGNLKELPNYKKGLLSVFNALVSKKYDINPTNKKSYWMAESDLVCRKAMAVTAAMELGLPHKTFPMISHLKVTRKKCKQSIFNFPVQPKKGLSYAPIWTNLTHLYDKVDEFSTKYSAARKKLMEADDAYNKDEANKNKKKRKELTTEITNQEDVMLYLGCLWFKAVILAAMTLLTRMNLSAFEVYPSISPGFVKGDYISVFGFALLQHYFGLYRSQIQINQGQNNEFVENKFKEIKELYKIHVNTSSASSSKSAFKNIIFENQNIGMRNGMINVNMPGVKKPKWYRQKGVSKKNEPNDTEAQTAVIPTRGKKVLLITDMGIFQSKINVCISHTLGRLCGYKIITPSLFSAIKLCSATTSGVFNLKISKNGLIVSPCSKYPIYSRIPEREFLSHAVLFDWNIIQYSSFKHIKKNYQRFYDISYGMTYYVSQDYFRTFEDLHKNLTMSNSYKQMIKNLFTLSSADEKILKCFNAMINNIDFLRCRNINDFCKCNTDNEREWSIETWILKKGIQYVKTKPFENFSKDKIYNLYKDLSTRSRVLPMAGYNHREFWGDLRSDQVRDALMNNDNFLVHSYFSYYKLYNKMVGQQYYIMGCKTHPSNDLIKKYDTLKYYDEAECNMFNTQLTFDQLTEPKDKCCYNTKITSDGTKLENGRVDFWTKVENVAKLADAVTLLNNCQNTEFTPLEEFKTYKLDTSEEIEKMVSDIKARPDQMFDVSQLETESDVSYEMYSRNSVDLNNYRFMGAPQKGYGGGFEGVYPYPTGNTGGGNQFNHSKEDDETSNDEMRRSNLSPIPKEDDDFLGSIKEGVKQKDKKTNKGKKGKKGKKDIIFESMPEGNDKDKDNDDDD